MSDSELVMGTIYSASATPESKYATNTAQEIVIRPTINTREYMLASERTLTSIWMTPEEDEAWKDL